MMGKYGKGMRNCCDSLAKEGVPHIVGCENYRPPMADARELAKRTLEHMGKADFQTVLYDAHACARTVLSQADEIEALKHDITSLKEHETDLVNEVERLREALEPLDTLAREVFSPYETSPGQFRETYSKTPDTNVIWGFNNAHLTYGDLRRARMEMDRTKGEG